jgi:hypothetical protein
MLIIQAAREGRDQKDLSSREPRQKVREIPSQQ